MLFRTITFGDRQIVVCLIRPNEGENVVVTEKADTNISKSFNYTEERSPNYPAPILYSEEYQRFMQGQDWQDYRNMRGVMGKTLVAVPVWDDVVLAEDWDDEEAGPVHAGSEFVIGWDAGYENLAIGTQNSLPNTDYIAPCIIGRLDLNDSTPLDPSSGEINITVKADRPIELMANHSSGGGGGGENYGITLSGPSDYSGLSGDAVTLSVIATCDIPIRYQWYFGAVKLVGETSAWYSFTLSDTTVGGYHVVVSNDVGHVTSRTARVVIAGIVSQFSSIVGGCDICQASNGNFYVVSTSGVYEVLQDGTYSLISTTATGDGICQKSDGYLYVSGSATWKLDTSGNTVQYSLRGGGRICEGYNGLLYVTGFDTNSYTSAIWSINSDGTYQRFASVGYYPYTSFEGICYDGTNFYVKNANNPLLCVISKDGSIVASNLVQVNGNSIINSSDGYLYVLSSQSQHALHRVTKAGVVTSFSTVVGHGICEASDHNFYVVDYATGIFKVTH